MQVGYEKIAILGQYLVDHCWTVACYQHNGLPWVATTPCRPYIFS